MVGIQPKAVIMDKDGLRRVINRISFEIVEKNKGAEELTLIGIRRRGAVIARRIADKISEIEGMAPECAEIDITPYRDDIPAGERQKGESVLDSRINVTGRKVIIVDDVLFTGRTVRAAMNAVLDRGRARCVQLAVIVDRGHRELPIRPDYIGKNIPTSLSEKVQVQVTEYDGKEGVVILPLAGRGQEI
ncbi:MAG: bifunctional pyr operon transcriptional regulator/uracil phosphoribosyltransferase PyrR [Bacillota bacterium]|nr:bifunctional pyr operon transcriptional regulator/uracil phosphoribosyltransferase PyrR [Bacillota bacterium]